MVTTARVGEHHPREVTSRPPTAVVAAPSARADGKITAMTGPYQVRPARTWPDPSVADPSGDVGI
jgi:hypothetical protein